MIFPYARLFISPDRFQACISLVIPSTGIDACIDTNEGDKETEEDTPCQGLIYIADVRVHRRIARKEDG